MCFLLFGFILLLQLFVCCLFVCYFLFVVIVVCVGVGGGGSVSMFTRLFVCLFFYCLCIYVFCSALLSSSISVAARF